MVPVVTRGICDVLQEAAREREIEERERKLGALMAEKGSVTLKKKTSKVHTGDVGSIACQGFVLHRLVLSP